MKSCNSPVDNQLVSSEWSGQMPNDTMTSLNDLPIEILVEIYKHLNLTETFKLRLNKRLDQVQLSTRHSINSMLIMVNGSKCSYIFGMGKKLIPISKTLEAGTFNYALRRIARITHVEFANLHDDVSQCIDAMFNFKPEFMGIKVNKEIELPEITFSQFLNLAYHVKRVEIDANFSNITAEHLCQLRKLMLDGKCAMKSFRMKVDKKMAHRFLKACFGVTIDDTLDSRVYHSENEFLEMFPMFGKPRENEFIIVEGTVCTMIFENNSKIRFIDEADTTKPPVLNVLWNHRYK